MPVMTGRTKAQVDAEKARTEAADEINRLTAVLISTDWYVTRQAETGKAVPAEVLAERQECRDKISDLRASMPTEKGATP